MAKIEGDKDMPTGRPAKNEQMKALQKAHGTAVRQATLPPFISEKANPDATRGEDD